MDYEASLELLFAGLTMGLVFEDVICNKCKLSIVSNMLQPVRKHVCVHCKVTSSSYSPVVAHPLGILRPALLNNKLIFSKEGVDQIFVSCESKQF